VVDRKGDQHGEQRHEDRQHAILALQEGHGAFGNGRGDLGQPRNFLGRCSAVFDANGNDATSEHEGHDER
jgi:hypothetical protein